MSDDVLMQGNEAIVEGALRAGARFFAGYPITPSSEIAQAAANRLPAMDGVYLQMEDELASMAAIVGASLAGVKSFTATSGPGFSLMQENLGMAMMSEVPCVVVNVQRSGPSTGLATKPAQADVMQARWGTHGDHSAIVLVPASVAECLTLTVRAFNLAEAFRQPVILLTDAVVGHMREGLDLEAFDGLEVITRRAPTVSPEAFRVAAHDEDGIPSPLPPFGSDYIYHANSSMHDERGYPASDPQVAGSMIRRLHDKIENAVSTLTDYTYIGPDRPDVLLLSYGATTRAALQLVVDHTERRPAIGSLQLRTLWPFPDDVIRRFTSGMPVVVPEMNLGQVVREVRRVVGPHYPLYSLTKSNGLPIAPGEIEDYLTGVIA